MFVVALGIRVAVAPRFGFYGDLNLFRIWATGLHDVGIRHFYIGFLGGNTTYVYPPGYLYILDLLAHMSRSPGYVLLKLPAMLGDLASRVDRRNVRSATRAGGAAESSSGTRRGHRRRCCSTRRSSR